MVIDVELVDRCTPEIVEAFCRDEPRLSSRPSRLKPEVLAGGIKARVGDVVAEQTEQGRSATAALVVANSTYERLGFELEGPGRYRRATRR